MMIVWRLHTSDAAVARAEKHLAALMRAYPDGVTLIQVAEPTAPPPSGSARNAVAKLLHSGRNHIKSSSLVCAGTGFALATARALVTGLAMLMRTGFPHEVFATVKEAADWHARFPAPKNQRAFASQDIVSAVADLTAILDKRSGQDG